MSVVVTWTTLARDANRSARKPLAPAVDMSGMLRPVSALFRDHAFWAALGAGTVVSIVAFALRRTRYRIEIGSGGVATLATLIGLAATDRASIRLVAALALLVLGGAVTGRRGFGWRA